MTETDGFDDKTQPTPANVPPKVQEAIKYTGKGMIEDPDIQAWIACLNAIGIVQDQLAADKKNQQHILLLEKLQEMEHDFHEKAMQAIQRRGHND